MIVLAVTPFVLSAALFVLAPVVARRCPPAATAVALTVCAVATALATGLVLCTVATLTLAEIPALGAVGHWSVGPLDTYAGFPPLVGVVAGAVALGCAASAGKHLVRFLHFARAVRRDVGALTGDGDVRVLTDPTMRAFAVPGVRGRIVLSTGLLDGLGRAELAAVLAHERAHSRGRHFVYVQLAELAAAANPLLRPAVRGVRLAVERWADERAAASVGDRDVVVRALAEVGLSVAAAAPLSATLPMGESDIASRVRFLLEPAPRRALRAAVVLLILVVVASGVAAGSAGRFGDTAHAWFEQAQLDYGTPVGR